MATLVYWLFCGSFLAAVSLHLAASLLVGLWLLWRDDLLIDWHANLMIAALGFGIGGTLAAFWLPAA
ncbi:hypothetical protein [Gloeobacter kilaueensis]|uniref:Uncharacterized protein n=1 Tax=Gloeobacter kilaueensis (strain ATCC BAA-2537 / CCAP 1431/1 / ULC 316 / JS1) TaxID=1183438 RepID=U5QIT3_GLOK1|nr:hypothetical protein [Gloeobacter kilaueensis]AGY57595.1 hypothetical protein GKIL_1349 [Gloeobacter kilaueensis JS1]